MSFWREPQFLGLLVLVPLAVVAFVVALRARRRALESFAEARLLATIGPDRDDRMWSGRAALSVMVVSLLVVALAGPKWGFHWQEIRREGIDLIIALDTSRSMLARDVRPNRIERAKLAIQDLVKQLRGDRIGLVAFAGTAFVQCPLTLDYLAFQETLRGTEVGIIPRGGTALGEAIRAGIEAFEGRQGRHAALVLITDGESNEGDLDEALKLASERGIKLFTVGIGTADGELIEVDEDGKRAYVKDRRGQVVKSRLDDETLKRIATESGGAYLHAEGGDFGLDRLYAEHIGTMEKRQLESTMERRYKQRFQWPLAMAFVVLLVEPLLVWRRRR